MFQKLLLKKDSLKSLPFFTPKPSLQGVFWGMLFLVSCQSILTEQKQIIDLRSTPTSNTLLLRSQGLTIESIDSTKLDVSYDSYFLLEARPFRLIYALNIPEAKERPFFISEIDLKKGEYELIGSWKMKNVALIELIHFRTKKKISWEAPGPFAIPQTSNPALPSSPQGNP